MAARPMVNQRTVRCNGEEWQVSLSESVIGGGPHPKMEPSRRLLRFSGAAGRYVMHVPADTRLDALEDGDLCERVEWLRGGLKRH